MLSEDYIVGLTDGEGSFNIVIRSPKKARRNRYKVECRYYVKMREDELPLLRKVEKFFGCGAVYHQKERRKNQRDCYRFEINDLKNLTGKVIPLFSKRFLLSTNRKRDFVLFSRIVKMVLKKEHLTDNGIKKILRLKSQMHM